MPVLGFFNSDYPRVRPDIKTVTDPYTGDEYYVVPPIVPDVAVIHAFQGDRNGGLVTDNLRSDRLLAMAARKTIAVVEELVEPDELVPGKPGVYVSGMHVDAVVVAPLGAHPTACRGRYGIDVKHMSEYLSAAKSEGSFTDYVEKYVTGPRDHWAYLQLVGLEVKP
jgi:glutaconate CoA-transferase subunit A